MSTATPPRLPPRQQDQTEVTGSDDAPPPYNAMPNAAEEQSVEYGPSRPFQPATIQPTQQPVYAAPQHPPPPLPPRHPPDQVPFWNGPNLTPQQTGYHQGGWNGPNGPNGGYGPHQPPFQQQQHSGYQQQYQQQWSPPPQQQFAAPQGPPPPLPHRPSSAPAQPHHYTPTQVATPGQPLLNKGRLLVFPVGQAVCPKCDNTGYKSNDPTHPCRKCWEKSGKPYSAALRLSHNSSPTPPPNFQRPLRAFAPPRPPPTNNPTTYPGQYRTGGVQVMHSQQRPPPGGSNVLVVRPGDPRIGGNMCSQCRGTGFTTSMWMFDEETCTSCRGAGRVFY